MKKLTIIIAVLLLAVSAWAGEFNSPLINGKPTAARTDLSNMPTMTGEVLVSKNFKCDRTTEYKKAVFLVSYEDTTLYTDWHYQPKRSGRMITEAVNGYVSREYCKNPQFVQVSLKSQFLDSNKKPFGKDYIIWDYREVEK